MMSEYCEGIDSAFLEDKNGNKFKLPKISDEQNEMFTDDFVNFSYKQLEKHIFEFKNTYRTKWATGWIQTDQQRIAQKLNLFKKLKFKRK